MGAAVHEARPVGVISIGMNQQENIAVKHLDRAVKLAAKKIGIGNAQPVARTGQIGLGGIRIHHRQL